MSFKNALKNVKQICVLFDWEFGEDVLEDSHILKAQGRGTASAIEITNRFFTLLKDAGCNPISVPFEKGVNPKGYLAAALSGGDLVYTEENKVTYYKRLTDMINQKRWVANAQRKVKILTRICKFESVNPKIFQVGDTVEAQISFVATPLQNGKQKLRVVLRSLALLDGKFSQVSVKDADNINGHCLPSIRRQQKRGSRVQRQR